MSTPHYIKAGAKVLGPFDRNHLDSLHSRGRIKPGHLISTDRIEWKSVDDFFADSSEAPLQIWGSSSEEQWYYAVNDRRMGPFSRQDLQALFQKGEVVPESLIWKEGLPRWAAASTIFDAHLFIGPPLPPLPTAAVPVNSARSCVKCGAHDQIGGAFCPQCGTAYRNSAEVSAPLAGTVERRDRLTAALLAFFLGGFGVHHFYLGNDVIGVLYLLFCWTLIPSLLAFIEGILLICSSQASFDLKYNNRH